MSAEYRVCVLCGLCRVHGPCVAMCCSVLQCVAVCCSVLQCVAECRSQQRKTTIAKFSVLHCVAV